MAEFFSMGGHGFYIWLSYAITAIVLAAMFFSPLRRLKHLFREITLISKHDNQ